MTNIETRLAVNAANAAVSQMRNASVPAERVAIFNRSDALRYLLAVEAEEIQRYGGVRISQVALLFFEVGRRAGKAEYYAERVREVCER